MPILNKKVVLFNGPPGAGKDTMVSELVQYLNFQHMKFSAPLKRMVAGLLDVPISTIEQIKDQPHRLLHKSSYEWGIDLPCETVRTLLIALSEDLLKARYSADFFGRVAVEDAKQTAAPLLIYSDCGFEPEVHHVIRAVGHRNCLLIRLHRNGHTYDNDSRSYLPDGLCSTVVVYNDDVVHNVAMRCLRYIVKHLDVQLLKEPTTWVR